MAELKEVCYTYSSRLVEHLARLTIVEVSRAIARQTCLVCPLVKVIKLGTIKDRSRKLHTELFAGSAKHSLEYLSEVHTRRHAKRVKHQVDRTAIGKERHVFLTDNL